MKISLTTRPWTSVKRSIDLHSNKSVQSGSVSALPKRQQSQTNGGITGCAGSG